MSNIRNTVNKWLQGSYVKNVPSLSKESISSNSNPLDMGYDDQRSINFKIITANGGHIIETSKYVSTSGSNRFDDDKKRVHNLYIVPDGEDMTEALGRIVTMESLR